MLHARTWFAASLFAAATVVSAAAPEKLGSGVTLAETTPIASLAANPAGFEGRTVRVEGVVKAVCSHMGCWMSLASPDTPDGPTVRFKVEDGVIVFPVSAKGRRAAAQGVVERVGGDAESREAAAEHAKAEGAKTANATWQIRATGALIY